MPDARSYVFAGGGTGGHLYPALAVAEEIRRVEPDARICFIGSAEKIESRVVPQHGYDFRTIWIAGFRRKFSLSNLLFPFRLAVSLMQARKHLNQLAPHAVVGTGGYVSGPVLFMAALAGIPTLIHEQNGVPGVTTRLLSKMVNEIHVSFAETVAHLSGGANRAGATGAKPVHLSGNPTRAGLDLVSREEALKFFGLPTDRTKPTILVFGGSQGARSINAAVEKHLAELTARARIIWQTGAEDYKRISGLAGVSASAYIDRMEMAYAAADLVICRAGATTIAELTRIGKPAILVPYPHSAGGHQLANARAVAAAGAALVIEDANISEMLAGAVTSLLNESALQAMANRSRALGKPDAASRIAGRVIALARMS